MGANKNQLRIVLIGPVPLERAQAAWRAAKLARQDREPNEKKPGFNLEHKLGKGEVQVLGDIAARELMMALDPIVRGEYEVDDVPRGWAMYMENKYGRHTRPDES